ncbi:CBN-PFN-2 protein [Caenorhabditis brenneri]|uniref:Profilin n=1 Tax=Caenorhabditis brenneri TaxID=135651 RepID=G0M8N2_CAEBE|nr:CBN-PFN-2 protein [Caenorhabditis brenneri]
MSGWDDYVKLLFGRSAAIKRAAIIGSDGSVWARSGDANEFKASDAELKRFAALFNDVNSVPGTGADLENIHYIVPRVEEKLIFGKKDQTGFFAAKTNQAIVIAIYEGDNAQSASVRAGVEYIAQYLASSGY